MNSSATLEVALGLASQGVPCFPCRDDKRPSCPQGFKAATADQAMLHELWTRNPGSLIGVPTGVATGMDVLDVDPRQGGDKWLVSVNAYLPPTQAHSTRSGGWHILFKHREGIRNSASKIAAGVDVRGDGGYIIWWPAIGLGVLNQGSFYEKTSDI